MQYSVKKLARLIIKYGTIYEFKLTEHDFKNNLFKLPPDYSWHFADEVPIELLKKFSRENRYPKHYKKTILYNLNNNDVKGICIVYKNQEIASLGWIYYNLEETNGIERIPFCKKVFYPMDGWVAKKHRGKNLHKFCVYKRFETAWNDGKRIGYGIVYVDNIAALKAGDKLGKRIGISYKIKYPYKRTINIYNISHLYLYLRNHLKIG